MIQFIENGNGTTTVKVDDKTVAGIVPPPVRGDQFFVSGDGESVIDGFFDNMGSAKKYVEKCLKETSVQTTEQDAATERAKARREAKARAVTPAPKPTSLQRSRGAKQAAETRRASKAVAERHGLVTKDDANAEVVAANRAAAEKPAKEMTDTYLQDKVDQMAKSSAKAIKSAEKSSCTTEGCGNTVERNGLCRKHYDAMRDADASVARCSVEGCAHALVVKGMCRAHYYGMLRAGKPSAA